MMKHSFFLSWLLILSGSIIGMDQPQDPNVAYTQLLQTIDTAMDANDPSKFSTFLKNNPKLSLSEDNYQQMLGQLNRKCQGTLEELARAYKGQHSESEEFTATLKKVTDCKNDILKQSEKIRAARN